MKNDCPICHNPLVNPVTLDVHFCCQDQWFPAFTYVCKSHELKTAIAPKYVSIVPEMNDSDLDCYLSQHIALIEKEMDIQADKLKEAIRMQDALKMAEAKKRIEKTMVTTID